MDNTAAPRRAAPRRAQHRRKLYLTLFFAEEGRTPDLVSVPSSERKSETSIRALSRHFHLPITKAAEVLGICPTVLKRICRSHGIKRWPHRKVSLGHHTRTLTPHTPHTSQHRRLKALITVLSWTRVLVDYNLVHVYCLLHLAHARPMAHAAAHRGSRALVGRALCARDIVGRQHVNTRARGDPQPMMS